MIYRAIGIMSGSSLDGLDIVFAELDESRGKWSYTIQAAACYPYTPEWEQRLRNAVALPAYEYLLLHSAYGRYIGEKINEFIDANDLHHKVQLIASHGHTTVHAPQLGTTAQLGDGATIAAVTGINVVSDLRALDVALQGQGAPIVPMGEKLLLGDHKFFLNLGGIANISYNQSNYQAFDICPANRVLNMLAQLAGKPYDEGGQLAAGGQIHTALLTKLNALAYYKQAAPKSLANDFGTGVVFPLIQSFQLSVADALRTYTEHIVQQVTYAVNQLQPVPDAAGSTLLVTGGGAFNTFLINRLQQQLQPLNVQVNVPDNELVQYKEALVMALLGVLRWREENTVMASVTGATRSSIGGAVWIGQDA
ncbi:anhydro-N-acetylmuramic acid kinase [Deminuibacter soli]|uniref:Anhydro-N-acetylmuramic acid kinase n=1 Tax=Deminuibacter soli TaxID=2291815 RepID=A0A3E1NPD5_9BACT|nr:anhydro-N-acetylmuramic acid kinase [Deminuibacter soli]RFM29648.1 anhydro-N-acetylmuramic acid kinase [Deminuibacter soli]